MELSFGARTPCGAVLFRCGRRRGYLNFARGSIVGDAALQSALASGALCNAVLDVFATEPLPTDSWHWEDPRVTVLPHISAPTDRESASVMVGSNIRRYRDSGQIPPCVDRAQGY
ncbi:NAD(P)-dependent oxidoreductase [Paraburkholderia sp. SG-MS1]|uniref:NAD(P)-dependent oxidoreductase n=1 Tax=Paraburkholderia sp. SG-MS1 TaxID=2023741 RepID=UPI003139F917